MLSTDPGRPALELGERPDPAAGIYETMLVRGGVPVDLEAHLARMRASALELYGIVLDDELGARVRARAAGHGGRLRLDLAADGTTTIETGPIGPAPRPALAPYVLPGGLGPHKLADRRLLRALTDDADGSVPLLVDEDGSVLETAFTSILIEERGRLIAPPEDRRALAGIGRLRLAFTHEPVDLDRLRAADAVLLVSALRVVRLTRPGAARTG